MSVSWAGVERVGIGPRGGEWRRRARTSLSSACRWVFSGVVATMALGSSLPAGAQEIPEFVAHEELDFDRPESWALKWFASASLLTSLGPVESRERGSVDLGFEAIALPHLDTEKRRVGFDGFKVEDLNRSPVSGRIRATFGIGAGTGLILAWSPPVRVDGIEANLVAVGLERPFVSGDRFGLGWRLFGQTGEADGDLTCGAAESALPPGEPGNEFGCQGPSEDEVQLDYYGAELNGSYRLQGMGGATLYFGLLYQHMDLEFQVNAVTFGFRDLTRQTTDGETWAVTTGSRWDLGERLGVGVELFYSPLDVVRPPSTTTQTDGLFNLRTIITYKARRGS